MTTEVMQYVAVIDGQDGSLMGFYEHGQFIGAFQASFMEALGASIPEGSSVRKAIRSLRSLKRDDAHRAVLRRALELLDAHGRVVPPSEVKRGELVATLPVVRS